MYGGAHPLRPSAERSDPGAEHEAGADAARHREGEAKGRAAGEGRPGSAGCPGEEDPCRPGPAACNREREREIVRGEGWGRLVLSGGTREAWDRLVGGGENLQSGGRLAKAAPARGAPISISHRAHRAGYATCRPVARA